MEGEPEVLCAIPRVLARTLLCWMAPGRARLVRVLTLGLILVEGAGLGAAIVGRATLDELRFNLELTLPKMPPRLEEERAFDGCGWGALGWAVGLFSDC